MPQISAADLAARLLSWYGKHARSLPWRIPPGGKARPDPYRIWLSEVMLQQTGVVVVERYFRAFLQRWPNVGALAQAPLGEVLEAWAGLGYYARARNLHACARAVVERHGGKFPAQEEELATLPGVGPYTAAAIASIAFGRRAVVVDGNVERVMARLFAVTEPLPAAKGKLRELAASLTPDLSSGDYAQAVMDLGATICTPKSPSCVLCPWRAECVGLRSGIAETLPARLPKPKRPVRRGIAFWMVREDGAVLLRRRPEKGLLGGMMEIPSTPWRVTPWEMEEALGEAPAKTRWRPLPGIVEHVFTHFQLELAVVAGKAGKPDLVEGVWCKPEALDRQALPSIMRKIVRHAQSQS